MRSVVRAIAVLRALEQGPQSLGRVAQRAGLSKPTVHRLLASLAHRQMVIQNAATGDYMLGPGSLGIADAVMRGVAGLGVFLGPVLDHLGDVTGETVAVYVRAGLERICIGQVPSTQPVRYTAHVGAAYPLHAGSMGKLLLAYGGDAELRELLDRLPLQALTKATITDRARLEDELAQIRRRGYATSRGERAAGVASMSAPIFAADGRILAAIGIIGPDTRLTDEVMARLRPPLLAAAQEVTRQVAGGGRTWSGVAHRKARAGAV
ncbi:MAG TPA: IclR family transcriptional regulator [Candidatus Limnocylindria bacterium]|nr:IclR family transcriptional regulator [Candidatus Limnocylindria bacterium]